MGWCEEMELVGFSVEERVLEEENKDGFLREALEAELKERKRIWWEAQEAGLVLIHDRRMGVDEWDERGPRWIGGFGRAGLA